MDVEGAAEVAHALFHADQAHAFLPRRVEAAAVIFDGEGEAVLFLADNDLHLAGVGVLDDFTQSATIAFKAADETILLRNELGALLGDILDALSSEELGHLPEPVWALLDFIAGSDAIEAAS